MAKGYPRSKHQTEVNFPRSGGNPLGESTKTYDASAHSMEHHGSGGHARGTVGDTYPEYHKKLQSEGAGRLPAGGPTFVDEHNTPGKAHHLPRAGEAHRFPGSTGGGGHSFGHSVAQRSGGLRMSGHPGAHRVGSKKK